MRISLIELSFFPLIQIQVFYLDLKEINQGQQVRLKAQILDVTGAFLMIDPK